MIKLFLRNKLTELGNMIYEIRSMLLSILVGVGIMVWIGSSPFIGYLVANDGSEYNMHLIFKNDSYFYSGFSTYLILGLGVMLYYWIKSNIQLAKNGIEVDSKWKDNYKDPIIPRVSKFDRQLKTIIQQGNQDQYRALIKKIVKLHRKEYTEDNLPTSEDFILELVNDALDEMWEHDGVKRDMSVYKTFIEDRENVDETKDS